MTAAAIVIGIAIAVGVLALLARQARSHASGPGGRTADIDPFTVGEPWRRHVSSAQSSQRRLHAIVTAVAAGPLRDRMTQIEQEVADGVQRCWEVAKRGDQLDATIRQLDAPGLRAKLARATGDEATSLQGQLAAVERIRATRDDADQRLRLLQTRLGELVGQAAEVATAADALGPAGELESAVDDVVTQLEALRLAVVEVNEPGPGTSGPAAATGG